MKLPKAKLSAPNLKGPKLPKPDLSNVRIPRLPTTGFQLPRPFRDGGAEQIVPRKGFTAGLTVFAAAAMAFLAVFTLALALAANRMAERWGAELAQSATIRIAASAENADAQVAAALAALRQTPGVASARAVNQEEALALLEPWFGEDIALADLPIPKLIELEATVGGYDQQGLRLRLRAEAPDAVLDDHRAWRAPLQSGAFRLQLVGVAATVLIGLTMAAIIGLAANAALSANAQVVRVLRLIGASDAYIAGAFMRRFTLRSLLGAAAGAVLGAAAVALMPSADSPGGFMTGLRFAGLEWLWPLAVPIIAALIALVATRQAAIRVLKSLS